MQALWGPFIGDLTQVQLNGFLRHANDSTVQDLRVAFKHDVTAFWDHFHAYMETKSDADKFWHRKKFRHLKKRREELTLENRPPPPQSEQQ